MKKLLSMLLIVAMMFSLVACAGKTETPAAAPQEDAAPEAQAGEFQATEDVVATDVAKTYKEAITIGVDAQITTLDPTQKNNVIQNVLYNCTHDTLINYNNDTGEYEPGLALSWEWKDDVTLVLKLREGVKFHDGSDFTSADVEASLGRTTAGLVSNTYDHSNIIDDYTIETVVKAPNVDWVFVLSHLSSAICSAEAIAENPDEAWVGTGPWKVVNFVSGDSVEMERFDDYWGELCGTKKLTLRYYGEATARLIALENGEIDLMTSISSNDLAYALENKDIVVENFVSSNLIYFCFNMESEVGKDENLRKAVAYAINRDAMITAAGGGDPAYTMWGWNSLGYTTDFDMDYSYNVEKAKEYADKAEHKEFTLINSSAYATQASVLQENLRAVGITMNIEMMDSAGIGSSTKWDSDHEAVIYSMATNPSGSDMFRLIAYGTSGNRANLHDEQSPMYTLQTASNAEFDETKRIELLKELQAYMHDNCIYYGLTYATANIAYVKGLENPGLRVNKNYDFSMVQIPLD